METEYSVTNGDFEPSFNFLASLINGNNERTPPSDCLNGDKSFNFLASLINGNFVKGQFDLGTWLDF